MTGNTIVINTPASLSENPVEAEQKGTFFAGIVGAAAFAHLLNDLIQALLPAVFPMLKLQFSLSFSEIGIIALVYQVTASLLQPWIGLYTDKHPKPYLLPCGMMVTLAGILLLATAGNRWQPLATAGNRWQLRHVTAGGCGSGCWVSYVPPGNFSRGSDGFRWPFWYSPINISSGW